MADDKQKIVIIGGGISGLATLHYLKRLSPDVDVELFEAADRLGGVIGTDVVDGYVCEWGPNGILDRSGAARELAEELGLGEQLESANENAKHRYILRGGELKPVPMSAGSFISSKVISGKAKLRLFAEPFTKPGGVEDESIYSYASRHFGSEVADYLIQPMVTGIYAGNAERLSVRSCFPLLYALDKERGSIIRGMIARKRASKKSKAESTNGSGNRKGSMRLLSAKPTGVHSLIDALGNKYSAQTNTSKAAASIERRDDGGNISYSVTFTDGSSVVADKLVLAIPTYKTTELLTPLSQALGDSLARIPYSPITVVCLGYDNSASPSALDGFGFLAPPKENRSILGAIWSSSIFSGRAPEGKFQLRVMIGGASATGGPELSDDEIIVQVRKELSEIMNIKDAPEMTKIYRFNQAIPQYTVGHHKILAALESELAEFPGLYLNGNAYAGIGVSECLAASEKIADSLLDKAESHTQLPTHD
jgi:oxygen-dependent protoporphyrinogen oxidase